MRSRVWKSACATVVFCAGCAGPSTNIPGLSSDEVAAETRKQQVFQIQSYFAQVSRVHNVAHRLTVANRSDCGAEISAKLGFVAITPKELPAKYRSLATEALGLAQDVLTVTSVVPGGPAEKAGILTGDELVTIDGETIPKDNASDWINAYLKKKGTSPLRLELVRSGKTQIRTVQPTLACSIPFILLTAGEPNAFTDGKKIVVHSAILRVAQTDAELAIVLGHELAHVTMGHIKKRKQNRVAGAVGGAVLDVGLAVVGVYTGGAFTRGFGNVGGLAYVSAFEREADYVGTYYVARAGYDPATAERFWRSLAQDNPKSISFAGLHPTTPERFLQMQKTNEEIAEKRRKNLPLRPELKPQPEIAPVSESDRNY